MTQALKKDVQSKPHYAGHRQRLRDRFVTGGPNALQDYELLELLLFMAIPAVTSKSSPKTCCNNSVLYPNS